MELNNRVCKLILTLALGATAPSVTAKDTPPVRESVSDESPVAECAAMNLNARHGRSCVCDPFHRAGHPECVSWLAVPSNSCRYGGYYLGGSLPVRGEPRCVPHEGTWGWDYFGVLSPKKIALDWGHRSCPPRGDASYKTDGPKLRSE